VALMIIGLVLLQRGKGAEAGTGFGAGASGTVFGSRGSASFFSRATAVLATLFFATSLALAYFSTQSSGSGALLQDSVMGELDENGAAAQDSIEALAPQNIDLDSEVPLSPDTPPAEPVAPGDVE